MSIVAELNRLSAAKSDIASAIDEKGVTVPSGTKLDGMADLILQISGGSVEPYAVIYAHYKPGATCVCSDGVTTLTAADTSGDYVFLLPNAGTWTVTATLDGLPSSYTVTINRRYQCEQVLLDRVYLIRSGVSVLSEDEWLFGQRGKSEQRVFLESGGIHFTCNYNYGRGSAQTAQRINFGLSPNYSTLNAIYAKRIASYSGLNHAAVGYTDLIVQGENDIINSRSDYLVASDDKTPSNSAPIQLSLDVSGVTREHYVALWVGNENIIATDLWLE